MASELRVNTLKDAAGNNSIAMSTVAPGSTKAFIRLNGTSTLAINKSLNHSSCTDNGTGNYSPQFSSNFSDVNSAVTCSKKNQSSNASFGINNASVATSNFNMQLYENNAAVDSDTISAKTVGDLA
tara:strand:- start:785 stop:1162 length:378 start_codon:yes stop_codon:yes gene_type:complete